MGKTDRLQSFPEEDEFEDAGAAFRVSSRAGQTWTWRWPGDEQITGSIGPDEAGATIWSDEDASATFSVTDALRIDICNLRWIWVLRHQCRILHRVPHQLIQHHGSDAVQHNDGAWCGRHERIKVRELLRTPFSFEAIYSWRGHPYLQSRCQWSILDVLASSPVYDVADAAWWVQSLQYCTRTPRVRLLVHNNVHKSPDTERAPLVHPIIHSFHGNFSHFHTFKRLLHAFESIPDEWK